MDKVQQIVAKIEKRAEFMRSVCKHSEANELVGLLSFIRHLPEEPVCDWKIKICLWECESMHDQPEEEEMLPFLPRTGDSYWMSDACQKKLEKRLHKCNKAHGCGDGCPFYDGRIIRNVIVHDVLIAADRHEIFLTLRQDGIIRKPYPKPEQTSENEKDNVQ